MKKNIVIFTNTLLSGGAEKQALLLAVNLNQTHNIFLIVYYGNKVEPKFQRIIDENDINAIFLIGSHLAKMGYLFKFIRNNDISIIFSYLLTTNLIGAVVGKFAGVPVRVGGIRNAELDKRKLPIQRFINNYLSTHTIYNNFDGIEKLGKKNFDINNALVIPNCFELTTTYHERPPQAVVNMITVGRFVAQKGYFDALGVMQLLKERDIAFKYFIVGYGELENEIRKKISQLQLDDYVEVVINPPNIAEYYQNADIYLCTSYFEGLSNTVMEALSFSMPVIATNVGDNNQLVQDKVNGYLIDGHHPELFIESMEKLIGSSLLRNQMGKESYQKIKEVYSGDAFKRNYENFISRF